MGQPIAIAAIASTSVDAASVLFGTWLLPNCNGESQKPTTLRLQVSVATQTILSVIYSATSSGTSSYGTAAVHAASSGTLQPALMYTKYLEARASIYIDRKSVV